jgi:hypothetical protein
VEDDTGVAGSWVTKADVGTGVGIGTSVVGVAQAASAAKITKQATCNAVFIVMGISLSSTLRASANVQSSAFVTPR